MSKNSVEILKLVDDWAASVAHKNKSATVQTPGHGIALLRDPSANMSPQARLEAQVKELDAVWVGLAQRATQAGDTYQTQMLLSLALRCQQQTTRAVQTLAEMKGKYRPPPTGDVVDID